MAAFRRVARPGRSVRAEAPLFVAGLRDALLVAGISLLATGVAVAAMTRRPRRRNSTNQDDMAIQAASGRGA